MVILFIECFNAVFLLLFLCSAFHSFHLSVLVFLFNMNISGDINVNQGKKLTRVEGEMP